MGLNKTKLKGSCAGHRSMGGIRMKRFLVLLIGSIFLLSACTSPTIVTSEGTGRAKLYRIGAGDTPRIQFRMLDSVNALRQASGVAPVELDAQLNAAAATHSRDMAVQNRPWHFGSDGSSPIERVARSGYTRTMLGENISETFETELETLAAWMDVPDTRAVILEQRAGQMGFAWFQETGGKIWWTLIMGGGGAPIRPQANPTAELPQG